MGISQTPQALVPAEFTSGGMTLLSTTALSGVSTTITNISQNYTDLHIVITNAYVNSATTLRIEFNVDDETGVVMSQTGINVLNRGLLTPDNMPTASTADRVAHIIDVYDYTSTTNAKAYNWFGKTAAGASYSGAGTYERLAAVTQLVVATNNNTSTFSGGSVRIYGVK